MSHAFPNLDSLLIGETIGIEYKRDESGAGRPLTEDTMATSLMALGNASGGYILVGIANNGTITGINSERSINISRLKDNVGRKFLTPPLLDMQVYSYATHQIIALYIPPALKEPYQLCDGTFKVRKIQGNRQGPENLPFALSELPQWQAQRGVHYDFSSILLSDLPIDRCQTYFNPTAISIFRQRLSSGKINNPVLRNVNNLEDQIEALGLVSSHDGRKVLTNAALILFGSNEVLRDRLPAHQTQFQVFAPDGSVPHNLFSGRPGLDNFCLLCVADRLDELFRGIVPRRELMSGSFRIDIPAYGDDALREATMNSFIHRDYTVNEPVVIQITPEYFQITNPGGFYRDVKPDNILFHEPCARNKTLAQACADIGLMEKSGRGVDRIFWDQIRFLRPMPSYTDSTEDAVRLTLLGGEGALENIQWMLNYFPDTEDLRQRVVHGGLMHTLIHEGESTREEMVHALPGLNETLGRKGITELIDAGLITRVGHGRGQRLILSEKFQKDRGKPDAFKYQIGLTITQQRKAVMDYVELNGAITRKQAADLLRHPADDSIYRLLKQLVDDNVLRLVGVTNAAKYVKA